MENLVAQSLGAAALKCWVLLFKCALVMLIAFSNMSFCSLQYQGIHLKITGLTGAGATVRDIYTEIALRVISSLDLKLLVWLCPVLNILWSELAQPLSGH